MGLDEQTMIRQLAFVAIATAFLAIFLLGTKIGAMQQAKLCANARVIHQPPMQCPKGVTYWTKGTIPPRKSTAQ